MPSGGPPRESVHHITMLLLHGCQIGIRAFSTLEKPAECKNYLATCSVLAVLKRSAGRVNAGAGISGKGELTKSNLLNTIKDVISLRGMGNLPSLSLLIMIFKNASSLESTPLVVKALVQTGCFIVKPAPPPQSSFFSNRSRPRRLARFASILRLAG
jgi:hypothetical protein